MLSFIKHNFDSVEGMGVYSTVATLTSVIVFVLVLAMIFYFKKSYFQDNAKLPLEDDEN